MHTHFSPDSEVAPEKLVERCIKVGLNCIAVTDHNTTDGAFRVREIAPFMVIIGEEVGTSEGEVTGLFLEETIPRGLPPAETARRIKEQGGLVSLPHPFDRFRSEVITKIGIEDVLPLRRHRRGLQLPQQHGRRQPRGARFRQAARPTDIGRQRRPYHHRIGKDVCDYAGVRRHAGGLQGGAGPRGLYTLGRQRRLFTWRLP